MKLYGYLFTIFYHDYAIDCRKLIAVVRVRVREGYYNYGGKTGDERIYSIRQGEPAKCVIGAEERLLLPTTNLR